MGFERHYTLLWEECKLYRGLEGDPWADGQAFQPRRREAQGLRASGLVGCGRGTAVQRFVVFTVFYVLAARTWTSHTAEDPTPHD